MEKLFVYGTLLFDQIMIRVCRKTFPSRKAILPDHARFRVRSAPYPAVIYRKGSSVDGIVYLDIDGVSLQILDAFEGAYYERISVDIISDKRETLASYAYRIKERYSHLLTDEPWDIGKFMSHEFTSFLDEIDTATEKDLNPVDPSPPL